MSKNEVSPESIPVSLTAAQALESARDTRAMSAEISVERLIMATARLTGRQEGRLKQNWKDLYAANGGDAFATLVDFLAAIFLG